VDKTKIGDWVWKGFTVLLSVIVVPCFVWVWEAESRLGSLEHEISDVDENVKKVLSVLEGDSGNDLSDIKVDLELMKRDIQKINSDLRAIRKNYKRK
tara:strand:+ start:870 stop:1160 length:291 start_codon:yes stop_codon:yes gene_type:complete